MNKLFLSVGPLSAFLLFCLILSTGPALAQEEYSGAFYCGDADGDGVIGPGDLAAMEQEISAGGGIYDTWPPSSDVQDLDGDAVVGPGDLAILEQWIAGNWATGSAGKPFEIELLNPTAMVPVDGSTVLCINLYDDPASGDMVSTPRAGWGVNFVISASDCPTAELYGRDPSPGIGGGKDQYVTVGVGQTVFEYTTEMIISPSACVELRAPGCGCGQITIDPYVPGDAEAIFLVGSVGRLDNPVTASGSIIADIMCCCLPIEVTPDPGAVNDGETIQMTAFHDIDGDVTAFATWQVNSGPCVMSGLTAGLVIANEGCADDSCEVQAEYFGYPDVATVNLINDDPVEYIELLVPLVEIYNLDIFYWSEWWQYTDGCGEEKVPATSNTTGMCIQLGPDSAQAFLGPPGSECFCGDCCIWDSAAYNSPGCIWILP